MKNPTITASSFQSSNDTEAVVTFLKAQGANTTTGQDIVKSFYIGNDYHLAVYDTKEGNNTMLVTIKNFAQNEDLLIELNGIFRAKTQHLGSYHILKFARQATDEVIGLIPTFKAFFGDRIVANPYQKINWRNSFTTQNTYIAA
jgi:hypothetical protein